MAIGASGCGAGKSYVDEQVAAMESRVSQQIDDSQGRQDTKIGRNSKSAQDALDRAIVAGKLAEGRLLSETVMSNEDVKFAVNESALTDSSRELLDALAADLKRSNENVFVEIQGHTDSDGGEDHNFGLGQERADAAMRHLHMQHGLPLHRLSAFSYGEGSPVADNDTREGRARNRRIVVVVMR